MKQHFVGEAARPSLSMIEQGRALGSSPPRPPYVADEWFRQHGVDDGTALLTALRPEDEVMRPERLRAIKATRLSFARSLMRRAVAERWRISRYGCDIDANGSGFLVYEINAAGRSLHFVVASCASSGDQDRLGRFYETEFDFFGSIIDGPIDLERARIEAAEMVAKVWRGRTDNRSLGWTVANKSNRFFSHVVERLASGLQPDPDLLASGGGYIIRNAGWYGNGRHGSRAWLSLGSGHPLGGPYHLDVFALYLWRVVSWDVAEAMARARSEKAVTLTAAVKRALGIGNSSGIGMVAALVRWPAWVGTFNFVRELALAYAMTRQAPVAPNKLDRLVELLGRAARYYSEQPSCKVAEVEDPPRLGEQLWAVERTARELATSGKIGGVRPKYPWAAIVEAAPRGSFELHEQVNAILIEVESDFADAAAELIPQGMMIRRATEPQMTLGALRHIIEMRYAWALALDLTAPGARAHFWYKSEENGENRRGERDVDPGVENETFVDVAGAVQRLHALVLDRDAQELVGEFLIAAPEHSHVVSRVQLAGHLPYTEVRGNILDRSFLPMDGIRFLLSTLGLEASHPYSTRWVRGVFFQGAPLPEEIASGHGADWIFPSFGHGIER